MNTRRSSKIRGFIIEQVSSHSTEIAKVVSQKFGISRQGANRYLKELMNEGILLSKGRTRNKEYKLNLLVDSTFDSSISSDLKEDKVWRESISPLLKKQGIATNVMEICQYGFTEMINNVVDHSEGTRLRFQVQYNVAVLTIDVMDNGVGIFNKIQKELGLEDHLHAILELAKGKLTTDPARHTGEGIFFASRMFDNFLITSGTLRFVHLKGGEDWLLEQPEREVPGTHIQMEINPRSNRTARKVFDEFSSEPDEYGFTKTKVPVELARYGDENLISRSQAKRLLARFERFKEVILDFHNIDYIGPAFADEIFRVFRKENPKIKLHWIRTNDAVERMIHRAFANR